jgi:hypothetical protein
MQLFANKKILEVKIKLPKNLRNYFVASISRTESYKQDTQSAKHNTEHMVEQFLRTCGCLAITL